MNWNETRIGKRFVAWLVGRALRRYPDFVIGGPQNPYMLRWWITPWSGVHKVPREQRTRWQRIFARIPLPAIYLHRILRSDDDRALHDHPWANVSILLRGSYVEHTINAGGVHVRRVRRAGDIVARTAKHAHRLEIDNGPCWSLFLTSIRTREWGFHCPEFGWVHWRAFTNDADNGATVGRGCDQDSTSETAGA